MNKQYMKTIIKKILFFVQEKSLKLTELNAILAEIEQFHLGYFFKHKISCCRLSDDSEATSMDDTSAATAAANKSLQSCPTVRPHRRQPTRLPGPWDSPGKNTGVGCHFLLQQQYNFFMDLSNCEIRGKGVASSASSCKNCESGSVVSHSLSHSFPHGLYSPCNSQGQNTGVSSLTLLQGSFPTQGSNPGLPYCRQILDQLSHKGSHKNCTTD